MLFRSTAAGTRAADPREFVVVSNKMGQGAAVDGAVPEMEGRMVRSRRFKYCAYDRGRLRESLVDMEKDPGETVNLAEDPAHGDALRRHRAMLAAFRRETNDPFQP